MSPVAGAQDVVLRVGGSPENVRTARLVAAAVARREGLPEDRVDEVRIAVGEAVTWAMHTAGDHVVELVLGPGSPAPARSSCGSRAASPRPRTTTARSARAPTVWRWRCFVGWPTGSSSAGDTTVLTWSGAP
jgi:hypothetical protein